MALVEPNFHELVEIDAALCAAAEVALPLDPLEPVNSEQERATVEENPRYDPQFCYRPVDGDRLRRLDDALAALRVPADGVGVFFEEARAYLRGRLQLLVHLGEDQHWSRPLYPLPPEHIISSAERLLSAPRRPVRNSLRFFNAEQQVLMLRARLDEYRLRDWRVEVRENISSTNTDSANRVINLRSGANYTLEEMKRLVVHEVDTHVLRAANGYCQPYQIFAVGAVPSYLMTEEGLAVINEERMGYVDVARNRTFAARVMASVRATDGPFNEIYREMLDHGFGGGTAFTIAKRVKRGLSNTGAPGGFIKDQAYLWGRHLVEEYVLAGGDLSRLYVGKVALDHVRILPQLGLRPPRYLPLPYA